jgi:hypothetical protein
MRVRIGLIAVGHFHAETREAASRSYRGVEICYAPRKVDFIRFFRCVHHNVPARRRCGGGLRHPVLLGIERHGLQLRGAVIVVEADLQCGDRTRPPVDDSIVINRKAGGWFHAHFHVDRRDLLSVGGDIEQGARCQRQQEQNEIDDMPKIRCHDGALSGLILQEAHDRTREHVIEMVLGASRQWVPKGRLPLKSAAVCAARRPRSDIVLDTELASLDEIVFSSAPLSRDVIDSDNQQQDRD